jgi:transcriptional regulator with XRE-family HTH domain
MITEKNKKIKYGSKAIESEFGPLTFGKLLTSYRLAEEISQTELAKKLKMTRQKLNDFESGRRSPSLNSVSKIATALNEHAPTWIAVVIEEMLRKEKLNYTVNLKVSPVS